MNVRLSTIIGKPVYDISSSPKEFMKSKIENLDVDAAFGTVDLSSIIKQFHKWT